MKKKNTNIGISETRNLRENENSFKRIFGISYFYIFMLVFVVNTGTYKEKIATQIKPYLKAGATNYTRSMWNPCSLFYGG